MNKSSPHERGSNQSTRRERVTFRANESLLEAIEKLVEQGTYPNRSEAIRDGLSKVIAEHGSALEPSTQESLSDIGSTSQQKDSQSE
jgi:Arc/MetJ-type ribon-helix-helix transcriptional regulator